MSSPRNTNSLVGFNINNYYLTKVLGSGASGTVYHATNRCTKQEYAIKVVSKKSGKHSSKHELPKSKTIKATRIAISPESNYEIYKSHFGQALFKEVILHSAVHAHPNIVSIIEVLDAQEYIGVVLEYCGLGDLFGALTEKNWYVGDETAARKLIMQLLEAVEYCHSRSVFHCDLKPENILVDKNGTRLKIADFGLASTSLLCKNFGRGSSYYMSPENIAENVAYRKNPIVSKSRRSSEGTIGRERGALLQSKGFPKSASDVWALGIILLNLLFGRNPWKIACIRTDAAYRDYAANYNSLKGILPVSDELNIIMSLVFHPDPYRRISISSFRERISACRSFINPYKDFPWFRPFVRAPVPKLNVHTFESNLSDDLLPSEVTQVHIEKLEEHFFDVSAVHAQIPARKVQHVRAIAGTTSIYATHIPNTISPPTSDSSLQSSNYGSINTSDASVSTINSTPNTSPFKRRIVDSDSKVIPTMYPCTPEKSHIPSPNHSGTIAMFHPNSSAFNL